MLEIFKNILWVFVLVGIFFLALALKGFQMKRASDFIIRDLNDKQAFDPASAVELPYTKSSLLNVGLRDYRPLALQKLLEADVVRFTEDKRFYLREGYKLSMTNI